MRSAAIDKVRPFQIAHFIAGQIRECSHGIGHRRTFSKAMKLKQSREMKYA
jgi:hypothetical protein